jgi:hypothetical protein
MLVVVVVKISSDAGLSIGQIAKNRPLTLFDFFDFEPGPEALRLRVVEAFTAPTMREHRLGLPQKGLVGLAHVLATSVGVDNQARGGPSG